MKKFVRQGLITSAIAAAGIASAAGGAFAQSAPAEATINFTGTAGSVCIFSNMVGGTLVPDGGSMTSGDPGSALPGSAAGTVELECTGNADISVSSPQDNGSTTDLLADPGALAFAVAEVGSPTGPGPFADAFADSGGANANGSMPGPFNETVSVNMRIDSGFVPEGAYNYNVIVTATPL